MRDAFRSKGSTGLKQWNGYIFDEWLKELSGSKGRRVLREMGDDALMGGILFAVEMFLRQTDLDVQAHPDAPRDAKGQVNDPRVDFVSSCFDDMDQPWEDTLAEILTLLIYGFNLMETIFKRRDGKRSKFSDGTIGWASWETRAQETIVQWEFDDSGHPVGAWQQAPPNYERVLIPMDRCLLFRTTVRRGNPEGRSIFRAAYRSWYFRKHLEVVQGIAAERDLAGLPKVGVPPEWLTADATPEEKAMLEDTIELAENVRIDEQAAIVHPLMYDENGNPLFTFELLSTGGQKQIDVQAMIQYYDQRIAMSVLSDFFLLGHDAKTGSYALSQDKTRLFTIALAGFLDSICCVINEVAIPRLLRLNGMPTENPPRLTPGDIEAMDLTQIAAFITAMSTAGFSMDTRPDSEQTNYLLTMAGLPENPDDLGAHLEEQAQKDMDNQIKMANATKPAPPKD